MKTSQYQSSLRSKAQNLTLQSQKGYDTIKVASNSQMLGPRMSPGVYHSLLIQDQRMAASRLILAVLPLEISI